MIRPTDLFIRGGKLFVVDAAAANVSIFDLKGQLLTRFGKKGKENGEFNFPTHLYVDSENRVYVTDSLNFRIQVFDATGAFLKKHRQRGDSSGHFSRPKGVAVDSHGHIYVADALFDNIQIFDLDEHFLMNFGVAGHQDGEFWLPTGMAIDEDDYIYVADSYNRRVSVYRYVGRDDVLYSNIFCWLFLSGFAGGEFDSGQAASIVNSKHNLSAAGPGSVKAATESQICIFAMPLTTPPGLPLMESL